MFVLSPIRPLAVLALSMRRISLFLLFLWAVVSVAGAQVLPPNEIQDPELRALQERNMDDLKQLGADILKLPTDYPFYLSRKLDLELSKQRWADRSEERRVGEECRSR